KNIDKYLTDPIFFRKLFKEEDIKELITSREIIFITRSSKIPAIQSIYDTTESELIEEIEVKFKNKEDYKFYFKCLRLYIFAKETNRILLEKMKSTQSNEHLDKLYSLFMKQYGENFELKQGGNRKKVSYYKFSFLEKNMTTNY